MQRLKRISDAAANANSKSAGIVTAKVSVSGSVTSKGGSVNIGGMKLEAKVEVLSATVSVSNKNIAGNISLAKANLTTTLPDNTTAKGTLNILSSTLTVDTKSNATTKTDMASGNVRLEKDNNILSADNQSVGIGVKAGPLQVDASLNVGKLIEYVGGVANFIGTTISSKISEYLPSFNQDQMVNK